MLLQWTVDTTTNQIGWEWVGMDGQVSSNVALYRVAARMYPVGSVDVFNTATGGASSSSNYEIILKYVVVA